MLITPSTNIILLDVPITMDYKNQLTFQNKEAQFNYFYNLPKITAEDSSYMRQDGVLRFPRSL